MKYNKNFIERIEKVYGANSMVAKSAKCDSPMLGRYLCDGKVTFTSVDILNGDYDELYKRAIIAKEKDDLYSDWYNANICSEDWI